MIVKPILIIHPNDRTTEFLDRIKNHLVYLFPSYIHHFNIYPNNESHALCLETIRNLPENSFVIFLGHGRSDKLFGAKGNLHDDSDFATDDAIDHDPSSYYYNNDFINQNNSNVFDGKKVFCLACNSNEKIADFAIEKGAKLFYGFGDIPTSRNEFEKRNKQASNDVVAKMKAELNYIVKTALAIGIKENQSFKSLYNTIRFIANQRLTDIIKQPSFKEKFLLADSVYYLQKESIIFGDGDLRVLG